MVYSCFTNIRPIRVPRPRAPGREIPPGTMCTTALRTNEEDSSIAVSQTLSEDPEDVKPKTLESEDMGYGL